MDTSVFIKNNYLASYSIKQLLSLSENLKIQLYITDIVKREYIKNLEEDFMGFSTIMSKNPIWKNWNDSKSEDLKKIQIHKIESPLYQFVLNEFKEKINQGIIKVIPTPNKIANKVIDLYFECKPPFDNKRKKHEFLDAFILLTIEEWCVKNKNSAILFSTDRDHLNFKSDKFRVEEDFIDFLENFVDKSIKIDNKPLKGKIDEFLKINIPTISEQIKYLFEVEIYMELTDLDFKLDILKVKNLNFLDYKIISANKINSVIEYMVEIYYKYQISKPIYNSNDDLIIEKENKIRIPFELVINLEKGIKKGGYNLIKTDVKSNYRKIKIDCS